MQWTALTRTGMIYRTYDLMVKPVVPQKVYRDRLWGLKWSPCSSRTTWRVDSTKDVAAHLRDSTVSICEELAMHSRVIVAEYPENKAGDFTLPNRPKGDFNDVDPITIRSPDFKW